MTLTEILADQIDRNPDGFTIMADGTDVPTDLTGYMVGGAVPAFQAVRDLDAGLYDLTGLGAWLSTAADSGAEYLGGWVDNETGELYIDAVDYFYHRVTATRMGRLAGELAIGRFIDGEYVETIRL